MFAIASPLFNQFVIDEVIVSGDKELLTVLFFGFALLTVAQTLLGLARSWILMRISLDVNFQWGARIFSHLTRLPVAFFEKRHLGDIVSRFGSIGAIQNTLSSLFLESVLDGIMALLALAMMLIYSAKLTIAVLIASALYGLLRWAYYYPFRRAAHERLVLSAKENSHFLETLRAISPIKLFAKEEERRSRWLNLKMDVQNRDFQTQKLGIQFKIVSGFLASGQNLGIFFIGANLIMSNVLTIGMLMAFTSYASTFSSRIYNLIDIFVSVRMLGLHCERLADIVLEEPEGAPDLALDLSEISADIEVINLKFRYADGEPFVLDGINLSIPSGQSIAIVGASGCGKTTLCKVILGLLEPSEGDVLIGGISLRKIGLSTYRQMIGTVMQDDVLLSGSIRDNISFFDANVDMSRVVQCAKATAIAEEISAMPMGFNTLIGDMGSCLSGGQKQRVLLARALYKSPRILALDEATSHLDLDNEKFVNEALSASKVTRIMIAHRPETIRSADRVVLLQHGKLKETFPPKGEQAIVLNMA